MLYAVYIGIKLVKQKAAHKSHTVILKHETYIVISEKAKYLKR